MPGNELVAVAKDLKSPPPNGGDSPRNLCTFHKAVENSGQTRPIGGLVEMQNVLML